MLARTVVQAHSYDYDIQICAVLYWLPVEGRIYYKMVLMTFNVLTTQHLYYLFEHFNYASQFVNYDLVDTVNFT